MLGNIHNVLTDLFDHLGLREDTFSWTYSINDSGTNESVLDLEIRLPAETFPRGVRVPIMVCKLMITRETQQAQQVIYLDKNTLFKEGMMTRVLEFLSTHPIDVI